MVDPLRGGDPMPVTVIDVDPFHDLAVLRAQDSLGSSVAGLSGTDQVALGAAVVVTGVPEVDDSEHSYRHLDATGIWGGPTTRDDAVLLGRLESRAVMRGMSGAPVRLLGSDVAVGVVSGRYNSVDGWLRDSVWVARTEDLEPLLRGVAPVEVAGRALPIAPVRVTLTVEDSRVRLRGPGVDVAAEHRGVGVRLADRVLKIRRHRAVASARDSVTASEPKEVPAGDVALGGVGALLAKSFLPDGLAAKLGEILQAAERVHQPVVFGIDAGGLGGLPWETLPDPLSGRPLALCSLVNVYRAHPTAPPTPVAIPLRILVAIASPETGGGELLDYERELRNVLVAVRGARQADARVRVVPFASTATIRAALLQEPVHVLHLTGHGAPGRLLLEDEDGNPCEIDADTFVEEAIPAGRMPTVVTLAACYTNVADDPAMPSFAARLARRGPATVIATETSVTDVYATRLLARVYSNLASADAPEVLAAVCDARRVVQRELTHSGDERDRRLAALDEWATVTVLCGGPAILAFEGDAHHGERQPSHTVRVGEVLAREAGEFVGRRSEQRRWPLELIASANGGMVLYGIGGVGKTTLATELARRVVERQLAWVLVGVTGAVTVDRVLDELCRGVRLQASRRGASPHLLDAAESAARPDLPLADRIAILRDEVLSAVPVLVLLDNFEDNLDRKPAVGGTRTVSDETLAGLLTAWLSAPGLSRLLITSRYPFVLPEGTHRTLSFRQVGPMSLAETRKLMWALPELDRLDEDQAERVWRMLGGHPRSLEYLDAILARGSGRFPDITNRLTAALEEKLGPHQAHHFLAAGSDFDAALSETVTLAADDVLLGDLLAQIDQVAGAKRFLFGVSVYRRPVDRYGLLFQIGEPDEGVGRTPDWASAVRAVRTILAEAGLDLDDTFDVEALSDELRDRLTPHLAQLEATPLPPRREPEALKAWIRVCRAATLLHVSNEDFFFVHRWTASELARRHVDPNDLDLAHRAAAAYWAWRAETWPQDVKVGVDDQIEARYHLLQAGDVEAANRLTVSICNALHTRGAWDHETALIHDTLGWLGEDSKARAGWFLKLAILAHARGRYEEAEACCHQTLEISEQLGEPDTIAGAYHELGTLAQLRGRYEEAEACYQRSLEIRKQLGDPDNMARIYHQLGALAQLRSKYDESEVLYHQSLEIHERLGNPVEVAATYQNLGGIAQSRGDYERAETRYRQALRISEQLGHLAGMAAGYHSLGMLAHLRHNYREAEGRYRQALNINERLENLTGVAASYYQLGMLAQMQKDYDGAQARYRQSLEINERLGDPAGIAAIYHQFAMLAEDRGNYEEAEDRYRQSLEMQERLGNLAGMANSYHQLGIVAQHRGSYDEAEILYRHSLELEERLGNVAGMGNSYQHMGLLNSARGNHRAAVPWHIRALAARRRVGQVPEALASLYNLRTVRDALGSAQFNIAALQYIPEATLATLNAMLDIIALEDITDAAWTALIEMLADMPLSPSGQ
jgi:tetratricopeptide (TPR) repeat protein